MQGTEIAGQKQWTGRDSNPPKAGLVRGPVLGERGLEASLTGPNPQIGAGTEGSEVSPLGRALRRLAVAGELMGHVLRFRKHVRIERPTDCHIWTGAVQSRGYGSFGFGAKGKTVLAHRFAWEVAVGPIGPGLVIDHTCKNRLCVNPAHLETVNTRENNRRGDSPSARNGRRTHCVNGHAFTKANTLVRPDGRRACRACKIEDNRAAYWKRQALEARGEKQPRRASKVGVQP